MCAVKVVKINVDGSIRAKSVNVGDIVSDGNLFYKVFEDDGVKKVVLYNMSLGELAKLCEIKVPDNISGRKVKVGDKFKVDNKVFSVIVSGRNVIVEVSDVKVNLGISKIDASYVVKIKV